MGFNINSEIFKIQLLLLFPMFVFLREIRYVIANKKYFLLMSTLSILSIFIFVLRGFYNNASLALYFFFLPMIVSFYKEKFIGYKIHKFILFTFLTFIVVQLIRGYGFNEMMLGRSRNMVSFYFFLYTIFYYIEKYRYTDKVEFWPALLSMIISLASIGRSGIITSFLLLFVIAIYKLNKAGFLSKLKYIVLSVMLMVISIAFFKNQILILIIQSLARFEEQGVESGPRTWITNIYLTRMTSSLSNFLIGFPLNHDAFVLFDYNLHNSFLSLHYFFGVFGLIIVYLIIKSLLFVKGKLLYKSFLCLLLIRGFTDQIFFINFNDIVIYLLFYLILDKKELNKTLVKTI